MWWWERGWAGNTCERRECSRHGVDPEAGVNHATLVKNDEKMTLGVTLVPVWADICGCLMGVVTYTAATHVPDNRAVPKSWVSTWNLAMVWSDGSPGK